MTTTELRPPTEAVANAWIGGINNLFYLVQERYIDSPPLRHDCPVDVRDGEICRAHVVAALERKAENGKPGVMVFQLTANDGGGMPAWNYDELCGLLIRLFSNRSLRSITDHLGNHITLKLEYTN